MPQLEDKYESPTQRQDKTCYAPFSCCFFERVGCRPDLVVGTGAGADEMAWRATGARRLMSFKLAEYKVGYSREKTEEGLLMLKVTRWLNTKRKDATVAVQDFEHSTKSRM